MAVAKSIPGFELKELNSELARSSMAVDDGKEDGGYFYYCRCNNDNGSICEYYSHRCN